MRDIVPFVITQLLLMGDLFLERGTDRLGAVSVFHFLMVKGMLRQYSPLAENILWFKNLMPKRWLHYSSYNLFFFFSFWGGDGITYHLIILYEIRGVVCYTKEFWYISHSGRKIKNEFGWKIHLSHLISSLTASHHNLVNIHSSLNIHFWHDLGSQPRGLELDIDTYSKRLLFFIDGCNWQKENKGECALKFVRLVLIDLPGWNQF